MSISGRSMALAAAIAASACVTINIYFPAAAAEKAADKIIDEVWQGQPGATGKPDAAPQARPEAGKEAK
jgi:hypothetical protein